MVLKHRHFVWSLKRTSRSRLFRREMEDWRNLNQGSEIGSCLVTNSHPTIIYSYHYERDVL